jgi:hypothetical protein
MTFIVHEIIARQTNVRPHENKHYLEDWSRHQKGQNPHHVLESPDILVNTTGGDDYFAIR